MSYSSAHETSYLRSYAFEGGARGPGGRVALLRCLRPQALPDPSRQCPPRASAWHSRKSRVRLPDGAQRHPCLRPEGPRRPPSGLLASQRSPRRLRGRHNREAAQWREHPGETLARLGVRWERAKRWMESPDPQYARKKGLEIG